MSSRPPHVPYDDNTYSEEPLGPDDRQLDDSFDGPPDITPRRDTYARYVARYQTAERERLLWKSQQPMMSEADYQLARKRWIDVWSVTNRADRMKRDMAALEMRICLHPVQRYTYQEYRRIYRAHVEEGWLASTGGPELSEPQFSDLRRELVAMLEVDRLPGKWTPALEQQEQRLADRLLFNGLLE